MRTLSAMGSMVSVRPETALLLCCARTTLDAERVAWISELLQKELDWPALLQTAQRHGVLPLLSRSLSAACPDAVPPAVRAQLEDDVDANTWYNRLRTGELLHLLDLLSTHGIPAFPYKGPVLAAAVYGEPTLRQFGDLDILVPPQEVLRARDLLLRQGYKPPSPMTRAQEAAYMRSEYHLKLVREEIELLVELHWAITSRIGAFPIDFAYLWQRRQPVTVAGVTVAHFHPEDVLLLLCVHGAKDRWRRLAWICDIAELLRGSQEIDWPRVIAQAQRLGGARRLWLGLALAHVLLGAVLPENAIRRIQADPAVPGLVAQVFAWLFQELDQPPEVIGGYEFSLRVRERLHDRIRYRLSLAGVSLTWHGKEHELPSLPASCSWLYYVLRPIRLMQKYGLRAILDLMR